MNLSNLQPAEGATHNQNKRLGRGEGSGKGGTAARGHKGAKSRSGYSKKIGFEGGQMPLQRRVPKFGFTNINRKEYEGVNLDTLQLLVDNGVITDTVDMTVYVANRLATKNEIVKILGRGELKAKLKVTAHKFTATAKAAIEAAGGAVRSVLESVGIHDVLSKSQGSSNPHNVVKATFDALLQLRSAHTVAKQRGISLEKVFKG